MYGNHPNGTMHKRDIQRKHRASSAYWRTSDGQRHGVTVRKLERVGS